MSFVKVLVQIADFFLKAAIAYLQSEQGQKEWSDIENAFEVAMNTEDNPGTEYTVQDAGSAPTQKRVVRNT